MSNTCAAISQADRVERPADSKLLQAPARSDGLDWEELPRARAGGSDLRRRPLSSRNSSAAPSQGNAHGQPG